MWPRTSLNMSRYIQVITTTTAISSAAQNLDFTSRRRLHSRDVCVTIRQLKATISLRGSLEARYLGAIHYRGPQFGPHYILHSIGPPLYIAEHPRYIYIAPAIYSGRVFSNNPRKSKKIQKNPKKSKKIQKNPKKSEKIQLTGIRTIRAFWI